MYRVYGTPQPIPYSPLGVQEGGKTPCVVLDDWLVYSLLTIESFQGQVTEADENMQTCTVIIHSIPTYVNVSALALPQGFLWLKSFVGSVNSLTTSWGCEW